MAGSFPGLLLPASPAGAHAVAGARVFVNTLLVDDPGVADEAALPTVQWQQQPGSPVSNAYSASFEFDKTLTDRFALGVSDGYDLFQTAGQKNQSGWENVELSAKYLAYVNGPHEFMVSLGVSREFARTGSAAIGNDDVGSTTPALYWGKGLGDLPIGWARAFAVTGTIGYQIADKQMKTVATVDPATGIASLGFNNGEANQWVGGLTVQFSIPYLQSQVRSLGLTGVLGGLTPTVEVAWSSAASRPNATPTQYLIGVGAIYTGATYAVGLEAVIPGNGASGHNIGVIGQLHLYFDDLAPHTLGRPLLSS